MPVRVRPSAPAEHTRKERTLKKSGRTSALFIYCRFSLDTYRGAKACPRLPVPTWFPFCRSCNRGLWISRRGAKIYPIPSIYEGSIKSIRSFIIMLTQSSWKSPRFLNPKRYNFKDLLSTIFSRGTYEI